VQVISGQPREVTHFFRLPIEENSPPPWEVFLKANPSLAEPMRLSPAQSAFLAGYLCHLLADWLWIKEIYAPVFGPDCSWSTFPHRLYLHNILRTYLDLRVLKRLPTGMGTCLEGVTPRSWLPFVGDAFLFEWRDFISHQLQPGAAVQTVEVFAQRQGISPVEFHRLLNSTERMEAEGFVRMPRQRLINYRRRLLDESIRLVYAYLEHDIAQEIGKNESNRSLA
jgi:hypothetical protein